MPNAEFKYFGLTIKAIIGALIAPKNELAIPPVTRGTIYSAGLHPPSGQIGAKMKKINCKILIRDAIMNTYDLFPLISD